MYDLIIIGAGPAGYVAAIRAGQIGLKTAIIDKKYVGGMCLNWGCIPTKTLIESAKLFKKIKNSKEFGITGIDKKALGFDWKVAKKRVNRVTSKLTRGVGFLLKKNGVEFIEGEAKIIDPSKIEVNSRVLETKNIFIATGSYPPSISEIPDSKQINLEYFLDEEVLPENPVVLGSGPVAIELAQFYNLLGKPVIFLNEAEDILPDLDNFLETFILTKFKKDKIKYFKKSEWKIKDEQLLINNEIVEFDKIINCQTRKAIIPDNNLTLKMKNGFIETNDFLQTDQPSIYAIGDVNGRAYVAHAASNQGLIAVNHLRGINIDVESQLNLINIYSDPEIAQIGKTEQELKDVDFKVSEFSLAANGKALAEGNSEGQIRILSEKKYGEVLGVQIIAANATDMIAEASALMKIEGTVYDLATTIHAHPTVSEVFLEVGLDAIDEPIHK